MTARRVGFLLGAGASFQLGMPLVTHLTDLFKAFYCEAQLARITQARRHYGDPYDHAVVEVAREALARGDMHYEAVLGLLQTESKRLGQSNELLQQYHGLYAQMVEAVYLILLDLHLGRTRMLPLALPSFEGFSRFAEMSRPVYVFSLNHDMMVEIIADRIGLPVRSGFWENELLHISYGAPNSGKVLVADVLTEKDLSAGRLNFFPPGEHGVNLLKLHGGLEIFAFRDGMDLCRFRPIGSGPDGILATLRIANNDIAPWLNGANGRAINEIMHVDAQQEIQFLRRTLLAGAHKFDKRHSQTLPQKMLEVFERDINFVHELYVIGYSFGDAHVDTVMREWLQRSRDRQLIVVDPFRERMPGHFTHLLPQVSIQKQSAAEFFSASRRKPLSTLERVGRQALDAMRAHLETQALLRYRARFARANEGSP